MNMQAAIDEPLSPAVEAEAIHQIKAHFSDGAVFEFPVLAGQSILQAAKVYEVPLMSQCSTGSCGTCMCKVDAGDVRIQENICVSLLPSEVKEGLRLACVSYAYSDSELHLDYPSSLVQSQPDKTLAMVSEIEWVARDVVRLQVELAEHSEFDHFQTGQYVRLKVPGSEEWRSYSMATPISALPTIEFLIRVLDDGLMSSYLKSQARVGDQIELEGPFGVFYLRADVDAPHLMIAGGTGLAPMMGMLEDLRGRNFKKHPVLLSFGCTNETSLFYEDELELRSFWMKNFEYRISVSRPGENYSGRVGYPHEVIGAKDVTHPDTVAYLCGPPAMIEASREHLLALGVKRENIYDELFVASTN